MRKIGYWSIYQFTPGGFFEPYGDSAGSLRLGETGWWELTTDYFARLSRDPGVMAGADYLRNRSPAPYGKRPYQWYVALSYDPSVRPGGGYDPRRPERWMRRHLPQAMLFGRDSLGVAFFRGYTLRAYANQLFGNAEDPVKGRQMPVVASWYQRSK